jgi:hypothetical protein
MYSKYQQPYNVLFPDSNINPRKRLVDPQVPHSTKRLIISDE